MSAIHTYSTVIVLGVASAGCSASGVADPLDSGTEGANADGSTYAGSCTPCVSDQECNGDVCAQIGGDTYCLPRCGAKAICGVGATCATVTTYSGDNAEVCAPNDGPCSAGTSGLDGGGPHATADAAPFDAGPPPTGNVGPNGGTLSKLSFAVIGDTRPPVINDTKGYPTAIITKIFQDVQGSGAPFAVTTGDYMFASTTSNQATPQLSMYLTARKGYANEVFPALGNHECTGAVTSNCGNGTVDGVTQNYSAFMTMMLGPIGKSTPYYAIEVDHPQKAWTAKLVFVAANAWTSAQATWLQSTLSQATTYTFIIRHEPHAASNAPGVTPSEQIMAQHPYTLAIVGHTHTYGKTGARQVTIGNGGAPLTSAGNYGWGMIAQRQDGAVQVDMIDYQSGKPDLAFRFAVKADGSPAP